MHKWLFAFLLVAVPVWGQQSSTGNLTAAGTVCASSTVCITLPLDQSKGGVAFTLSGSWSATVQFEASADGGVTYQAINATPSNSTTAVTSATGNGVWQANVAGFTHVRIRCSAFSSGPIVATINASSASARANGSGGSTPTLDQVGNPAAQKTFSTGSNTPVAFSSPGVFTSTATTDYLESILTGGGACNEQTTIGTGKIASGITGLVCLPTSNVTNTFNVGVTGVVLNPNGNSTGNGGCCGVSAGAVQAIGVYGVGQCTATNTNCLGVAAQAASAASLTGVYIVGLDDEIYPFNSVDNAIGIYLGANGSGQPAANQMPAVLINKGTETWTSGVWVKTASTTSPNFAGLLLDPASNTANSTSQSILFNANDSGVTAHPFQLFTSWDNTNSRVILTTGQTAQLSIANVSATAYQTTTNCSAVGTAASPSVASCGSAAAGQFSCATNATGATCTVNTTAVTANSEIFVQDSDTTVTGTRLGVTCNTSTAIDPVSRLLASSVAATSFTINLGTVTTNPACFSYRIIN